MTEEHEPGRPWGTVELAKAAGVNDSYLRQLLLAGKLQGYKVGQTWLIPDDVARAWLEERQKRWH